VLDLSLTSSLDQLLPDDDRHTQKQQQQQHAGMNGAAAVHANANAGQQHQFDITDASPVVRDMWLYIQVRTVRCYSYTMSAFVVWCRAASCCDYELRAALSSSVNS
jgi:hypothetical protein